MTYFWVDVRMHVIEPIFSSNLMLLDVYINILDQSTHQSFDASVSRKLLV